MDATKADVRTQVTPGEAHEHAFSFDAEGKAVEGRDFVVRRPTRGMKREIMRRLARSLTVLGVDADVLNTVDGRFLEAEAYLGVMLATAPEHWHAPNGDLPEPALRINFDALHEDELGRVWAEARRYLARFDEFRLQFGE